MERAEIAFNSAGKSLDFLENWNDSIGSATLNAINYYVLLDSKFFTSPGGSEHHHNYKHGLVMHVSEVMRNVVSMTGARPSDELVTAVIWHDYMKTRDYDLNEDGTVKKLTYRKLINHVSGSAMEFDFHARVVGVPQETRDRVEHLLLSHHGRKEWGSPVEPLTAEAFILHAADMMSAHGANL